ncbi:nucleotidyltransferase family protein [Haliovirga abyssi]|uniref:Polymerase beta nucleotidyltransferase domain-containing protein n=1 Tax=Haliovirga abyssi TaxID=2996794 RepID=A0AAU9DUC0_9FUSO|nr:nucleotidyltransferase domain-containing protein [Haliovirga abyssi]BDU50874.1 hypothetical protein HLVA_14430 [Haliovirga abyssi]
MKNISEISLEKIDSILEKSKIELKKVFGKNLKKIIFYGSYARNEEKDGSDIDIMALADINRIDLSKYRDKISDIMVELSLEFDLLVSITEINIDDFNNFIEYIPFYETVEEEGIELYAS